MRRLLILTALSGLIVLPTLAASGSKTQTRFPPASDLPSHPDMPDPLVMFDGSRVTTREQWFDQRRPELKALFQHYMYGYLPPAPAKVESRVERQDRRAFGGKATLEEVTIPLGPPDAPRIHLLLVVPNHRQGPAPVFLGLNFSGNHALVNDPNVRLPEGWVYGNHPGVKDNRATEAGRGKQADVWSIEEVIDRGYAVATFYCGDVEPDVPETRAGIRAYSLEHGITRPGPDRWGAIAAWAWGLSRAVDYLAANPDIDGRRIAVVGHSRLGKAAMLAAAFDERIALAIPHQAGCGGTAPSRGKVGESVKQINDRFPHWFDDVFKEFNDRPDRLPFDQNCLVALAAPRPVLFTCGVSDTWSNPEGQFQVLRAADPVYRFLGVDGLDAPRMPEAGKLVGGRLGYHIRSGGHSMGPEDWKVFLEFADRRLKKPSTEKGS